MSTSSDPQRHALVTRIFHGALATAVILQLVSSTTMEFAYRGHPGNLMAPLHEYTGIAALALAVFFWLTVILRRRGTPIGMLVPWFSVRRLRDLWADIRVHVEAARTLTLPDHDDHAPLPSAVHGLGLLLVTGLAATGSFWFVLHSIGLGGNIFVRLVLFVHAGMGVLAWTYFIAHVSLAFLHHVTRHLPLNVMWSLKS